MKEKIIRLKECFRVSKSVSGFQRPRITISSSTLCVIPLFFSLFFDSPFFLFFFIAFLGHTHFILIITLSYDLGMPPNI
jgi:hypothetical protein